MMTPFLSKTPHIILNEIRMMSAAFKGIHFLVEGDDDCKFWKRRLKTGNVSLVDCGGRPNLLGVATQVEGVAFFPVAGVYDPDFDRLLGIAPHSPSILVPTDDNALEIMLLRSEALELVLEEVANAEQRATFEKHCGMPVVNYLEMITSEFGRLRFLNSVAGHCVDFNQLSPYRFLADDWSLNLSGLKTEYAKLARTSLPDLDTALAAQCQPAGEWAYCQGHDAVRILAHGLRRCIGRQQMDEQGLTRLLRLAYSDQMLKQTAMFAALDNMAQRLPVPLFP